MADGSESRDAISGAEAAFASYLARVRQGETVDFEQFCAERPSLAESLRVMFSAWQTASNPPSREAKVETIGEFLTNQNRRGNVSLDPDAPADEAGSGIRERLAQLGRRTGRYNLREEVARGGMGVILKIWDKDLRRTLAMKASFHHFSDLDAGEVPPAAQEIVARFVDEAQITAQLDHPGIVPVHELGIDDDGRMYFTMRLVKGHTLDEIIRLARADKDGWNRPRAVGVMVRVCEAMAYAHAKGVIHRDLKPANIMVGDFGEVYVMDWGLAKVLGRHDPHERAWEAAASVLRSQVRTDRLDDLLSTPDSPLLTMDGMVLGTPTYMPPEQAEGRIDALDPRSDVYSVGALLYTLLTGRMPYVDPSEPPTAGKVIMALIEGPPAPVLELDPGIPAELVAICEKAMARDPDERYQNMGEMAEDLRAFVENRVVRAYASGPMAEFRKWVHRNRGVAAAIALLIIVTLGGSFFVAWMQNSRYVEVNETNKTIAQLLGKAEANERRAVENAERAHRNELQAARQGYLASLAAANGSLRMSEVVEARDRLSKCAEAYRGWEWDFLWYATDTSIRVLDDGQGRVTAVRFSPDGSRIVMGTAGDSMRIWDVATGRSFPLPDAPRAVTSLAFSRDGSRIAAASRGSNPRIWDAGSATLERMLPHDGDVTSVAFLGDDGARLVTGDDSGAHVWDVAAQRRIATLSDENLVNSIAVSADDRYVVTADEEGAHVFELESGEEKHTIPLDRDATCVTVHGGLIAVGSLDEMVRIVSLETGRVLHTLEGHTDGVTAVEFSVDGKRLVSSSFDRTLRVWNVASGAPIEVLRGHSDKIRCVHCSADVIVSGSDDGTLRLWRPIAGGHVVTLAGDQDYLAAVAVDPVRGLVAAASNGHGEVRIWDPATGAQVEELPDVDLASLSSLAFSPDGATLATAGADHTIRFWNVADGKPGRILRGHGDKVCALAFHPDGSRLASASHDTTVRIWDTATGELLLRILAHDKWATSVAFSADGATLASASYDTTAKVWRTRAPEVKDR